MNTILRIKLAVLKSINQIFLIIFSIALTSRLWAKVISSIVVVVSNYFISKLLVFKKK